MSAARLRTLAATLALVWALGSQQALATGGSVNSSLTINPQTLQCGSTTTVTLQVDGQSPPPGTQAVDVMLSLDISGSMGGAPIANLRTAATTFVNIMDAGDGAQNGTIDVSRVGLVAFSTTASLRSPLTHNAAAVNSQISALVAGGTTNISHGIDMAQSQLAASSVKRVLVLMTDGVPNASNRGGNPTNDAVAAASDAKAAGTEIYTIGLGSASDSLLRTIATDAAHYYRAPSSADLQAIFTAIAQGVAGPAATNLRYSVSAAPGFELLSASATDGTVTSGPASLDWTMSELRTQSTTITYEVRHTGSANGLQPIHSYAMLSWQDDDGNPQSAAFDSASVDVQGCNNPPTADAGPDQTVPMAGPAGETVLLDGTGSTDDGQTQPLSYAWYEGATLLGTGAQLSYTFPYGTHAVTLAVFDGEYTDTDEMTVTITDPFAPTTTITLNGTAGNNGWYVSPVTVDVSAADNPGGSGLAYTNAAVDGAPFTPALTLNADGVYSVEAYSADLAGNVEAPPAQAVVMIDQTAPVTAATLDPAAPSGLNGWYNGPMTLTLSAADATSGVAATRVQVNGGAWEAYTGAMAFTADGLYTVSFLSTDMAGNAEAAQAVTFQVDAAPPVITIAAPQSQTYTIAQTVTFDFAATDNLSGVDSVTATMDGTPVTSGQTVNLWTLTPGAHTLTVTATDMAGNSRTESVTFEVEVTYDSLEALKHWFADNGYIDNQGIVNSLDQKLRAARAAHVRGQHHTEDNILRAFISEVQSQAGQHIFSPADTTLIFFAQYMMDSH